MKSIVWKILLGIFVTVLALGVAFVVYIFTVPATGPAVAPQRAEGIPADHVWAGGLDGGRWYKCEPKQDATEFFCSIYTEEGSLIARGTYKASRPIVAPFAIISGDMDAIELKDQQQPPPVLKSEGPIEDFTGTHVYKNGEPVEP